MAAMSTFPQSAQLFLLLTPLQVIQISLPALPLFLCNSGCISIFVSQFPFLIIHFYKMSHGLIAGKTERQHSYTLCFLCMNWIPGPQWPVAETVEAVTWLLTDHDVLLTGWFVHRRASGKAGALFSYSPLIHRCDQTVDCIVGGLVLCN